MKLLSAVRLVNWYHFQDQTLSFRRSCALLGNTGSGKSTVLDAIQWALVADQVDVRFNKAANELGRRSLHGYVCWKLGSEDESRPGQLRFGRPSSTTYVLLEFEDDRDPGFRLVCGTVLDAVESDTGVSKWFFTLPGVSVSEIPAVEGRLVRSPRDFKAEFKARYPHAKPAHQDAGLYRDDVRHRLGALPSTFQRLLVKALDFRPIRSVREFVLHYLLDPRPIDTEALQHNLEHYKKLEAQAADARRRLDALDEVCAQGDRIASERRTIESHRYLYLRADEDQHQQRVQELENQRDAATQKAEDARGRAARLDGDWEFNEKELDRVRGLLAGLAPYRELKALLDDRKELAKQLAEARESDERARAILEQQESVLNMFLAQRSRDIRKTHPASIDDELFGAADPPAIVARLREALAQHGSLGGRDLRTWTGRLERALESARKTRFDVERQVGVLRAEANDLEGERKSLDTGRQRYPTGAEALLHLLRAKLRGSRDPKPLCELIEVTSDRWRDAVEGYLNTRRWDILVAPEDFPRALELYERNKRNYVLPGHGPVWIANVGLVDIEKIAATSPRVARRSLAEQVETTDPLARPYVDHLLGDLICCENEQELRQHRRGITDTVMVYQGYVARQMTHDIYTRHYIGTAARVRRLEAIATRLSEIAEALAQLASAYDWLQNAERAGADAVVSVRDLSELVTTAEEIPHLIERIATTDRLLASIDRREIDKLATEKKALDDRRDGLILEMKREQADISRFATEAVGFEDKRQEELQRVTEARQRCVEALANADAERQAALEERYTAERRTRTAPEIYEAFERQHRNIASRVEKLVQELVALKRTYVDTFGFPGHVLGEEFSDFTTERETWRESKLPQYADRISTAKEEAIQQLTEDIIFRLRENLVSIDREMRQMNQALKEVAFGDERYEFTWKVARDHREFYDTIIAAGQFTADSLFGNAALENQEVRRTIQELFDRLLQAEAREVKTELERRADYREYFEYDLRINHANGTWSLYDRVAGDKSGGETQTPYYISIFASMARLYRSTSSSGQPACGLVLLDEAFAKMDDRLIAATLRFGRDLGLQIILAVPKDRAEMIAPHMDGTKYIHKDAHSGLPRVLDFTKELVADADAARGRPDDADLSPPAEV